MTDHHDFEDRIKAFEHKPAPQSRQTVMNAYRDAFGAPSGTTLWKRPIPLYAAAAFAVLLIAGGFLAGRQSAPVAEPQTVSPLEPTDGAVTSHQLQWRPARNDLL